jgi:excisionase family DNA binding protein
MATAIEPLYTLREVARLLHVSESKAWLLSRAGTLPGIRVGRQWRFRRSAIEAYLDAHAASPAQGSSAAESVR